MVQQHIAPSTRNMPPRGTLANHPLGDADVDSTDKGTVGVTCTGTVTGACRILDLDFDGDYDSTDATKFDSLTQGQARHPGKTSTGVDQPFAHQGLLFEPELASYQNRARQYDPGKRRFMQRDPLWIQIRSATIRRHNNLYECKNNNPIMLLDPAGLDACSDLVGGLCGGVRMVLCLLCGHSSGAGESANALLDQWEIATGETDPCRIDAMQHCLGGALAGRTCGIQCAMCLGELLEIIQGDDSQMDLDNNASGTECAGAAEGAVACCQNKLNSGNLNLSGDCD